jgi:hypothetical protein
MVNSLVVSVAGNAVHSLLAAVEWEMATTCENILPSVGCSLYKHSLKSFYRCCVDMSEPIQMFFLNIFCLPCAYLQHSTSYYYNIKKQYNLYSCCNCYFSFGITKVVHVYTVSVFELQCFCSTNLYVAMFSLLQADMTCLGWPSV